MTAAVSVLPCELRSGKLDDVAYVVDCWTKNDPELRKLRLRDSTRHVRALLGRPESRLIIAYVPSEPDAILGWMALEAAGAPFVDAGLTRRQPPCLHYVYVRSSARRLGVARTLLSVTVGPMEYSHTAPRGVAVPSGWTLNIERARTE